MDVKQAQDSETMRFSSPHALTDHRACRPIFPGWSPLTEVDEGRDRSAGMPEWGDARLLTCWMPARTPGSAARSVQGAGRLARRLLATLGGWLADSVPGWGRHPPRRGSTEACAHLKSGCPSRDRPRPPRGKATPWSPSASTPTSAR
jgi:hypothetical protein